MLLSLYNPLSRSIRSNGFIGLVILMKSRVNSDLLSKANLFHHFDLTSFVLVDFALFFLSLPSSYVCARTQFSLFVHNGEKFKNMNRKLHKVKNSNSHRFLHTHRHQQPKQIHFQYSYQLPTPIIVCHETLCEFPHQRTSSLYSTQHFLLMLVSFSVFKQIKITICLFARKMCNNNTILGCNIGG